MKLAILGATGGTGREAVRQALAAGHTVTALVRSPEKLADLAHDQLTVTKCDVFSQEELSSHLPGHDALLSCLGFMPQKPAVTGYLEVTKAAVGAMRAANVSRILLCHSWYTAPESRGEAPFLIRWVLLPMIRTVLDNMRLAEEWLEQEGGVQHTVVRPAGLTSGPVTGGEFKVCEGGYSVPGAGARIARADVARFMLASVDQPGHHAKGLAIAL